MKKQLAFLIFCISFPVWAQTKYMPTKTFQQYTKGQILNLSLADLNDQDIPPLIHFLKQHPQITALDLSYNNKLTAKALVPLALIESLSSLNLNRSVIIETTRAQAQGLTPEDLKAFVDNQSLQYLNLKAHYLGDEGAIALAKNTTLKSLDLGENSITDRGAVAIAKNNTLEVLHLNDNPLGLRAATAFSTNKHLQLLDVNNTRIDDDAAEMLAKNTHLTRIKLAGTLISDRGILALAANLRLEALDLCGASLTAPTAVALAKHPALKKLVLCRTPFAKAKRPGIGDKAAIAFAENRHLEDLTLVNEELSENLMPFFAQNSTLKRLNLYHNPIGPQGAYAFLNSKTQLQALNMSFCQLGDEGANYLATLPTLKHLALALNQITDKGANALAQNTTLTRLNLSGNRIDDEGAISLANNETLSSLDLSFNWIGELGLRALMNNPYIAYIDISGQRIPGTLGKA